MSRKLFASLTGGLCTLVAMSAPAYGQVNIANGKPIVAFSGEYNNSTFAVANVTDGQNAVGNNDLGEITEPSQDGSFWLQPDTNAAAGINGAIGYFVIDLATAQGIGAFQLFNTRNGAFDDSGTGSFTIRGSNNLSDVNGTTSTATVLASGTLTEQTYPGNFPGGATPGPGPGATPLVPDTFASSDATPFRYVRFDAQDVGAATDKGFGDARVGLNEIRIFAVPEPASLALLSIFGPLAVRRRTGS